MLSCGVGSAGEISSGVPNFTFLRAQHSFKYVDLHILEGAGLLSSPPPRESRTAPDERQVLRIDSRLEVEMVPVKVPVNLS
jgi:hypothetical protein